jgi:hypothetical protein
MAYFLFQLWVQHGWSLAYFVICGSGTEEKKAKTKQASKQKVDRVTILKRIVDEHHTYSITYDDAVRFLPWH